MDESSRHGAMAPAFVCDVHLGKLASHLRMFGFDTAYRTATHDDELVDRATREGRFLLSKDRGLVARLDAVHALLVREAEPRAQLFEVMRRLGLRDLIAPFTRCIECNAILVDVEKEKVLERIPLSVREWCDNYQMCDRCDRLYWKGSHYAHMEEFIGEVIRVLGD
ncbi:MAG: Mut7-C RNAse domain-containing protein [Bacteroidota bacterium]